jgi:hypothetical protein
LPTRHQTHREAQKEAAIFHRAQSKITAESRTRLPHRSLKPTSRSQISLAAKLYAVPRHPRLKYNPHKLRPGVEPHS